MNRGLSTMTAAGLLLVGWLATGALAQNRGHADAEHAWLGVYIRDLEREDRRQMDLASGTEGVVVSGVDDQGPAARAGIRAGDVITEIDGRGVRDQRAFVRAVQGRDPGDQVRLTVLRSGSAQSIDVELEARPGDSGLGRPPVAQRPPEIPQPPVPHRWTVARPRLGVEVMELNPDLAAYFGVRADEGVLVTRILEGGGAERAGMKSGDVILRVDGKGVSNAQDLQERMRQHDIGDSVDVVVRRRNRDQTLPVEVTDVGDVPLPAPGGAWGSIDRSGTAFDNSLSDVRRQLRDLQRQIEELEREVRTLQRR